MWQIEGESLGGKKIRVVGVPGERLRGILERGMVLTLEKQAARDLDPDFFAIVRAESLEELKGKLGPVFARSTTIHLQMGFDDEGPPPGQG